MQQLGGKQSVEQGIYEVKHWVQVLRQLLQKASYADYALDHPIMEDAVYEQL